MKPVYLILAKLILAKLIIKQITTQTSAIIRPGIWEPLAPAGIAVLVSWLGRPLGRLGARCAFGPVAGVIRRQRDRTGFLPRLNVGGAVGILGMVQSIAVLRGKNHSAVITALVGQMAAADRATHKTALLFSSGITQKTTIALSLLYNPGKAKGKGLRSVLRQFMRFCCAKHA